MGEGLILTNDRKRQEFYYAGATYPVAAWQRVGRKKERAVMIIPAEASIGITPFDEQKIREFFQKEWGGHHHIMFLPKELYKFYEIRRNRNRRM